MPARRIQTPKHPVRLLAILGAGLFLLLGGLWAVSRSGVIANRLKPQVETELSKALNRTVTIERVEGGIFDRVILRHVRISAKGRKPQSIDITIDRVVVQYSLWDILVRKKPLVDSLHQIEFIEPLLEYERGPDGRSWRGPDFADIPLFSGGGTGAVPAIKLVLTAGEIRVRDRKETASIRNLRGLLNLRDPSAARLYLSGRTDGRRLQNLKISGLVDLNAHTYRLGCQANRFNLHPLEVFAGADFAQVLSGHADIQLNVVSRPQTRARDLISGASVDGKLVLYDLAVKTAYSDEPLKNLYGVVRLQDRRLSLANLQMIFGKTNWSARGVIEDLRAPTLNIRVQSEHLQLADLVESFPRFSQLKARGSGHAAFLIKGPAADPTVTANFEMTNGKLSRLDIQKFEIISNYHAGELRLLLAHGQFARGAVDGSGSIFFPDRGSAQVQFQGTAKELSLEDVGSLFGVKDVRGIVDGTLTVHGPLDQPIISGRVHSPLISAVGVTLSQAAGQLEASGQSITADFQADWGMLKPAVFRLRAARNGQGWRVAPFSLSESERELLRAEGEWNAKDSLDIRIKARQLPLQLIPQLPASFAYLNGHVNFDGRLEGLLKNPKISGSFNSPAIMSYDSRKIDARGEFNVENKIINLKNLWMDGKRIHLQGTLQSGKPGSVVGSLTLAQMPCQDLAALAGMVSNDRPSGQVNGRVNVTGTWEHPELEGSLDLGSLKWMNVAADQGRIKFSSNGKRFWLKQLELQQPQGKFNASLETDLGNGNGAFELLAWAEHFTVKDRVCSGNLKVTGSRTAAPRVATEEPAHVAAGKILVDGLEINHKKIPDLEGQFRYQRDVLQLERLVWGKDFLLSGWASLKKDQWSGNLKAVLENSDLEGFRLLAAGKPGLKERLTGTLEASLAERQAHVSARLVSGGRSLNGDALLQFTPEMGLGSVSGSLNCKDMRVPVIFDLLFQNPADSPQGTVAGNLAFKSQGELESLSGALEFSNFVYGRWNMKTLKTAWTMDRQDFKLTTLEGIQPNGSLKGTNGSLHLNPDGSRTIRLDLAADNFYFFTKYFHGHFNTEGTIRTNPFDLKLDVRSKDFGLNNYVFGDFRAGVHYRDDHLSIRSLPGYPHTIVGELGLPPGGAVVFERLSISDEGHEYVSLSGRVETSWMSDVLVKVHDVKADTIARSFGWPQPWTGVASGTIRYWEEPPQNIFFKINVKVENGSIVGLKFNSLVGTVSCEHHWLYFRGPEYSPEAAILSADKYTMYLKGRIPLPQDAAAEARMKGAEMDLHLTMPQGDFAYMTFIPYVASASGASSLDLRVRGTMDYPSLSGRATVHNGTLAPRIYTPLIENLEGDIRFEDNQTTIQTLQGKVGEGTLVIQAGPAAPWACIFRRLQPDQLNLRLDSMNGRLKLDSTKDYEFVSAWVAAHVLLNGTLDNPVVSGGLECGDGSFAYPPKPLSDFARQLKGGNLAYDHFKLTTRKNLWFRNDMIRAELGPDQTVSFNGGRYDFSGEGKIRIAKGSFSYLDNDFTLDANEETAVYFQGRETPQLRGLATSTIRSVEIKNEGRSRDATIKMRIQGPLGELKISLESDPVMTQAQIFSLLTLGEDSSSWSEEEIDQKVQAAGARVLGRLAGNIISNQVEKNIKQIVPLDVVNIRFGGLEKVADNIMSSGNTGTASSQSASSSLLQDTQIDVGKYLTEDLFLNYRGTLKDRGVEKGGLSWESYFGLEYNINPTRKFKAYKNFDPDSDKEMFVGIEGRTQFKGWSPAEFDRENAEERPAPNKTPTPRRY